MGLHDAFAILSEAVEQHESRGGEIRQVEATTSDEGGDTLQVTLGIPVSLCAESNDGSSGNLSPEAASLTDDGRVRVEFSPSVPCLPSTTAAISASEQAVRVVDDGLRVTVELTIDPTDHETQPATVEGRRSVGDSAATRGPAAGGSAVGTGRGGTDSHDDGADAEPRTRLEAARTEELPPYEDTAYLQQLYETCDTFTEMSRTIEMDVSSETVRRYLIEAGIHEPTTYETATSNDGADGNSSTSDAAATDAETAEPLSTQSPDATDAPEERSLDDQLVTDGLGLPEDVCLENLVDATVESKTVHEVTRQLDLDRRQTRELLEQLNLLDLVMHRISGDWTRDVTYEEVTRRIRQCASARSEGAAPVT
jgi:hypothetical protein